MGRFEGVEAEVPTDELLLLLLLTVEVSNDDEELFAPIFVVKPADLGRACSLLFIIKLLWILSFALCLLLLLLLLPHAGADVGRELLNAGFTVLLLLVDVEVLPEGGRGGGGVAVFFFVTNVLIFFVFFSFEFFFVIFFMRWRSSLFL